MINFASCPTHRGALQRLTTLNGIAITQMKTLLAANNVKRLK